MDTLQMSPEGRARLEVFEGRRLVKYQDRGGKWTIGVGHLILPGENFDCGISDEVCDAILSTDLAEKTAQMWPLLLREPTQWQFEAMLSLVFNIGVGVKDGVKGDFADSTLLKFFNAGYIGLAADEFPKWCYARVNGVLMEVAGLKARREQERLWFLGKLP